MKNKKTMYQLMLAYGFIAAMIVTCIMGVQPDAYLGLALGIGSLMINYWLLTYTLEGILSQKISVSVIPIGLSRFMIFGIAGWFCYRQSHLCVLLFAAGILALPVAALIESVLEVEHD